MTISSSDNTLLSGPKCFSQAIQQAHQIMLQAPWLQYSDEPELEQAAAEQQLKHNIAAALDQGFVLHDPRYPEFCRLDRHNQFGLVNPDNLYFLATIETPGSYVIHGKRGTSADLQIQIGAGNPGFNENLTYPLPVDELEFEKFTTQEDGRFKIFISDKKPVQLNPGENWLCNTKGPLRANSVLIRESLMDWNTETGGTWYIERVDTIGTSNSLPSVDVVDAQYQRAADYLLGLTKGWVKFVDRLRTNLPVNRMSPAKETQQGLPGQFNAAGHFQLTKRDAFIIEVEASDARYQGIQVGDLWFSARDYRRHQNSLTTQQAHKSEDDKYRFVISLEDPGVENWLDPAGATNAFAFMRWQNLPDCAEDPADPITRKVAFRDLKEILKDEPRFTAEQRAQQLAARHTASLTIPRGL